MFHLPPDERAAAGNTTRSLGSQLNVEQEKCNQIALETGKLRVVELRVYIVVLLRVSRNVEGYTLGTCFRDLRTR